MRNFICFFAGSICLKGYINLHRYLQTFLTQQFNLKSFFSRNLFLVFPPKGGKIRKIIPTVIHQSCQPRPLLFFPGSSQPGGEKKNYPKNPNKMVQNSIILSFFLSDGRCGRIRSTTILVYKRWAATHYQWPRYHNQLVLSTRLKNMLVKLG